ncbi:hypothetical protein BDZ91DRAFT_335445 [Kalaharituber pfeilii]|nr:hypothetical protein BDZ91DRAFT_335445 [Kalaharituber pfeilii]
MIRLARSVNGTMENFCVILKIDHHISPQPTRWYTDNDMKNRINRQISNLYCPQSNGRVEELAQRFKCRLKRCIIIRVSACKELTIS